MITNVQTTDNRKQTINVSLLDYVDVLKERGLKKHLIKLLYNDVVQRQPSSHL